MSLRALPSPDRHAAWADVLRAAVEPDLQVDVHYAPPTSALFGKTCAIARCEGSGFRMHGMCGAHAAAWDRAGRPNPEGFIANPPVLPRINPPAQPCEVEVCNRSRVPGHYCSAHSARWHTQGRPDTDTFSRSAGPVKYPRTTQHPGHPCLASDCDFIAQPARAPSGLCDSHNAAFKQWAATTGRTVEAFLNRRTANGRPAFRFTSLRGDLSDVVRLELQYGLQIREAEGTRGWRTDQHSAAVDDVAKLNLQSLLDLRELFERAAPRVTLDARVACAELAEIFKTSMTRGFIRRTIEALGTLQYQARGQTEYDQDVWRFEALGVYDEHRYEGHRQLDFRPITITWLRQLVKRWIRWRITSRGAPATPHGYLRGLHTFSRYLAEEGEALRSPLDLDRDLLLDYAEWLNTGGRKPNTVRRELTALNTFLHQVRLNGWEPKLAWNAAYFRGESAPSIEHMPRFLQPEILAQIKAETSLARLPDDIIRTMMRVVLETGLRSSDLRRLPIDCVFLDGAGSPNLRPTNWKKYREFAIPISDELNQHIARQRARAREQYPETPWLFPRTTTNPKGSLPYSYGAFKQHLSAWIEALDLHDTDGTKVAVSGHVFRHSVATLMLNNGMPLHAVQAYLDHDSIQTTGIYAKVLGTTLRKEWDAAQESVRVNIQGEILPPPLGLTESNAKWLKDEFANARATQVVAHGWCEATGKCPHANACWTCDNFASGPPFLNGIKVEHRRTLKLVETATANGRERLAEMNTEVAANMQKVITSIEGAMERDAEAN